MRIKWTTLIKYGNQPYSDTKRLILDESKEKTVNYFAIAGNNYPIPGIIARLQTGYLPWKTRSYRQ